MPKSCYLIQVEAFIESTNKSSEEEKTEREREENNLSRRRRSKEKKRCRGNHTSMTISCAMWKATTSHPPPSSAKTAVSGPKAPTSLRFILFFLDQLSFGSWSDLMTWICYTNQIFTWSDEKGFTFEWFWLWLVYCKKPCKGSGVLVLWSLKAFVFLVYVFSWSLLR